MESISSSLMSPMVLAFLLGIIATTVKSDLRFPDEIYSGMTIYLLFAIGLKGGMKLDGVALGLFWKPATAALILCLLIPWWSYYVLRRAGGFDAANSGAIAAHYGSVSAVTFSAALAFVESRNIPHEGFMPALLAIMEVPAIIVSLYLASRGGSASSAGRPISEILHELFTGKGIILLLGGMAIGLLGGRSGYADLAPFFDAPFRGVLTLFLLEVGLMTGRRLHDLKSVGAFLGAFAIIMPLLHGSLGVTFGYFAGLSAGGATILGTLAASASYIAAPAAVRVALPQANPAYYLTAALAITFPFNILVGIPTYAAIAKALYKTI